MKRVQLELFLSILAVLATIGLVAIQDHPERMEKWETYQRALAIQRGAELYAGNCRSCHGVNGEGVGDLGPPLNDEHFFTERLDEIYWAGTLMEYIANVIATGRIVPTRAFYTGDGQVAMNAWAQVYGGPMRSDEINDLTDFVMNWEPTALGQVKLSPLKEATTAAVLGDVTQGEQIFKESGCADCHTIKGVSEGEATAPDLTHIAATAANRQPGLTVEGYLRESFLIPNAYIVDGYNIDSGCGGVLSSEQFEHLIAFLLSLE